MLSIPIQPEIAHRRTLKRRQKHKQNAKNTIENDSPP